MLPSSSSPGSPDWGQPPAAPPMAPPPPAPTISAPSPSTRAPLIQLKPRKPFEETPEMKVKKAFEGMFGKMIYNTLSDEIALAGRLSHTRTYIDIAIEDAFSQNNAPFVPKVQFSTEERIDLDEDEQVIKRTSRELPKDPEEDRAHKPGLPHENKLMNNLVKLMFVNSRSGVNYIQEKIREKMLNAPGDEISLLTWSIVDSLSLPKGKGLETAETCMKIFGETAFDEKATIALKITLPVGIQGYKDPVDGETYTNDPIQGALENAKEVEEFNRPTL
jgi:hypothetical protein